MQDVQTKNVSGKATMLVEQMRRQGSIPAMSENVNEIYSVTRRDESCARDLSAVIMRDCGLTSNLLVTINSTFYSPKNPVKTITSAVTFLGFKKVYMLAMGLSLFKKDIKSGLNQDLLKLYACSYFSGMMSMNLAHECHEKNPEEAFVGGLLYQLPSLALAYTFPDKYKQMDTLIQRRNCAVDLACKHIFGTEFSDICQGVGLLYHMPESIENILIREDDSSITARIIDAASRISNMIFGNIRGGKYEMDKLEKLIRTLTDSKEFSLNTFIRESCNNDNNVKRFFKIDEKGVGSMIRDLERGKGTKAEVLSQIEAGEGFEEVLEENVDHEELYSEYIGELEASSPKCDLNHIISLAQEAIYRIFSRPDVITAFSDIKSRQLRGRFYAGDNLLIDADDFFISLNQKSSLAIKALNNHKAVLFNGNMDELRIPGTLQKRLASKFVMIAPIIVGEREVGVYFISQSDDIKFTTKELSWLEQIVANVVKVFERQKGH